MHSCVRNMANYISEGSPKVGVVPDLLNSIICLGLITTKIYLPRYTWTTLEEIDCRHGLRSMYQCYCPTATHNLCSSSTVSRRACADIRLRTSHAASTDRTTHRIRFSDVRRPRYSSTAPFPLEIRKDVLTKYFGQHSAHLYDRSGKHLYY
ncbi:hypothetical protein BCR34DRAFT_333515 [Clohesyomyces aquaticus]|uniref:Uncharacterized protein n=1 Tax=Clohesyomyces aquaticus TaxID=1231657 RepID=A0A1Y1ZLK6_9PLEO|nr:hypothetical protein BCR34DRAFT_333515 [Clohesyomyces aquaticus]